MPKVAIIGGGALGREIHCWLMAAQAAGSPIELAGYADDSGASMHGWAGVDLPYLGTLDTLDPRDVELAMAIASPPAKRAVGDRLRARGARFATIVHPSAVITHTAILEEGTIIGPHAYVASHARIEPLVLVNSLSGIGHDTLIGACTTISSQVDITGGVIIGAGVFIGSGARILPNVEIGASARIGAGSVVVRRVKPGQTMFAAPARLLSDPL